MTEQRKPRGRPFQRGQSGNPGGRPKEAAKIAELARGHAPEAVETLVLIMRECRRDPKTGEMCDHVVQPAAIKASGAAAVALLDRGFGKPAVTVEAGDGNGTSAALAALLAVTVPVGQLAAKPEDE